MKPKKLVIVGGVAAGASAAAKARRCDEEAEIIVFEKGPHISYATCGLPYYLSGVISDRRRLLVTDSAFFWDRFRVAVRVNREVIEVDRTAKTVTVRAGDTGEIHRESYDKLILAPGASPVVPPLPGVDLPFVFTLKTLEDTDRVHSFIREKKPKSAVVIGCGLIGMEVMENFAVAGMDVAMVEFTPQVLPFLDWEMAELVRAHALGKKVALHLSEKVTVLREEKGRGAVETDKGRILSADLVILSVGIRPNIGLAREAGLEIGPRGGIVVNSLMETSDPDIYAAGDCVESIHVVTGKPAVFPMGSAANKQGRAAGANAMGRRIEVKGFTGTVIVKVFDLTVAKTGLSEREALAEGFDPAVTYVIEAHHAGYYPGAKPIRIKTVADQKTGRLLGAQIIGEEGVDKRIDVMATAIYNGMAAEDLIHLDLAYAPPYSSARDPILVVGALHQNFVSGEWAPITSEKLHEMLRGGAPPTVVDVRTEGEIRRTGRIPGAVHIPIDALRERIVELNPAKEIVLYCAVGLRSYIGNRILLMNGFRHVHTLTGGITSWPYPLARE